MLKEYIIKIRNTVIGFLYQRAAKQVMFLFNPEEVHDRVTALGERLGKDNISRKATGMMFRYKNSMLKQQILGINFENPIGLAAGFDKNALLTQIIPEVGFGFEEVGSVTGKPCIGNPGKRLWRLPKSKSLVVYYGLMNDGCQAISARLENKKFRVPIGISIAKTNCKKTVDRIQGIKDYVRAYRAFENIGDYYTINISCPNIFGGQQFQDKESLDLLLKEIFKRTKTKPVFVKISPDLSLLEVDDLIKIAQKYEVDGFVVSNLTKNRENKNIKENTVPDVGGLSGKIVEDLANKLIQYIYSHTDGRLVIIGCGGVFTPEDAYKKIRLGASLVQLITGMIYQGPQVISEINQGLVTLLKHDGFSSIAEAVGVSSEQITRDE